MTAVSVNEIGLVPVIAVAVTGTLIEVRLLATTTVPTESKPFDEVTFTPVA